MTCVTPAGRLEVGYLAHEPAYRKGPRSQRECGPPVRKHAPAYLRPAVAVLFKGTLVPLDPLDPNDSTALRAGIVWNGARRTSDAQQHNGPSTGPSITNGQLRAGARGPGPGRRRSGMKVWVVMEAFLHDNDGDYDVELEAVHASEPGAAGNLLPDYERSGHKPGTRQRYVIPMEVDP